MITPHKAMAKDAFKKACRYGLDDLETKGYVSMVALEHLFTLFYWVYYTGSVDRAIKNKKMRVFFSKFDLEMYKTDSPMQSAVVFYNKLTKLINIRAFEEMKIDKKRVRNKKLNEDYFTFKELYDVYKNSDSDIPSNIIELNSVFGKIESKDIQNITSLSEVFNRVSVSDIVRPDFKYKVMSGKLKVFNSEEKEEEIVKNKMFVIQDCSYSMHDYEDPLKMVKAYILETALQRNYTVEWLYVTDGEDGRNTYDRENIIDFKYPKISGFSEFDVSGLLVKNEFKGKKAIIITDGTDNFDIPKNLVTKQLNVVSFRYNEEIRTKILNYGKFFKVSV
jgi:hypothetical protein